MSPKVHFDGSAIEYKSTFCSKLYQQSSENQFGKKWRQLFINLNLFSNVVNCFFYGDI